jgi:hypothetical protein
MLLHVAQNADDIRVLLAKYLRILESARSEQTTGKRRTSQYTTATENGMAPRLYL